MTELYSKRIKNVPKSFVREILKVTEDSSIISFAGGLPNPKFFPIEEIKKAVNYDGVELMGYTPWGIIDLVSFTTGEMKKRYGMIYVDRDNEGNGSMERLCKDSYLWYKEVIYSDGENI